MEKALGSTRRVFVFKNIVIKFARIRFKKGIKGLTYYWYFYTKIRITNPKRYFEIKESRKKRHAEFEQYRLEQEKDIKMKILFIKRYEQNGSPAQMFFSGIMANLQEYKFYRKNKNLFVMPTYFTFFGLFNIQKRGTKIDFWENKDVWSYLLKNIQNYGQAFQDGHTLSEIENYCLDDGFLKIVDYGSRRLEPFLLLHGENLFYNFKAPD